MMKSRLIGFGLLGALVLWASAPLWAGPGFGLGQGFAPSAPTAGPPLPGGQSPGGGSGTLPLPGVRSVISIDAHNMLLVELEEEVEDALPLGSGNRLPQGSVSRRETQVIAIPIRHVYSGGIALLLGGQIVPTWAFLPAGFSNWGAGANGLGFGRRSNRRSGIGGFAGFGGMGGF